MPANTTFHSATSSDGDILNAFKEIGQEVGQDLKRCHVTVTVANNMEAIQPFTLFGVQEQPIAEFANQHTDASWSEVVVHFLPLDVDVVLTRKPQEGYDEVRVSFRKDPEDPVEVSRTFITIQHRFTPLNRAAAIERALGPEMAEFYRLREQGLSRLESLARTIVKETHEYHMKLDAETTEQKRSLTDSFGEKEQTLEKKYEERTAELEAQEKDLNKLRQELDDRSARHARREQSRKLQDKIADRSKKFALTPDTQRKRWPVHGIFVVLLVLTGGLVGRSLLVPAMATEGVALWLELGRLPLGMLGFALTAIFYIRWNDHWFRQHADQEFRLQQLALDVDRAGYATEMLLEWQEDKGGEMPAVMVDRLTAGLFTDQTTSGRVQHPSEDAVSVLLKAASNIRLNLPGIGEVTLTGRNINKLDRDLNKKRED